MLEYPATYTENGQTRKMPNPSRPIKYEYITNNLEVSFESGQEQRRQKGLPVLSVEFSYTVLTVAQADTIVDFFIQCHGSVYPFTWTDPVSKKSYTMRFDMKQLSKEHARHSIKGPLYKITVTLRQVLA